MKMTKKFDDLNETFNVSNDIITPEVEPAPVKNIEEKKSSTDITKDYEYTRGNLYSLIEKGQEAINGILELAQETEQARAYEVAGQLIKSVADATDKLMELQKRLKEVEEEKQTKIKTLVLLPCLFPTRIRKMNNVAKMITVFIAVNNRLDNSSEQKIRKSEIKLIELMVIYFFLKCIVLKPHTKWQLFILLSSLKS